MLREWLSGAVVRELPIAAMVLFLLLFVGVLWRVARRRRDEGYRHMAALPLGDDAGARSGR